MNTRKKKKVLFVVPSSKIGGTNVSLRNMLTLIDSSKYDISIFFLNHDVHQTIFGYPIIKNFILSLFSSAHTNILKKIMSVFVRGVGRIFRRVNIDLYAHALNHAKKSLSSYLFDVVVAYQEGLATSFSLGVSGVKHIAWIHCEYDRFVTLVDKSEQDRLYLQYDNIVCVSNYACNVMKEMLPQASLKIHSIPNMIDSNNILNLARQRVIFNDDDKIFRIVSIGRIDEIKRFSKIPCILHQIQQFKCSKVVHWYLIGGVRDYSEWNALEDNLKKYNVRECFQYLGEQDNPYPYLKQADLLVSLSPSETFSYVINESLVLGTPVVATPFGCISEFVTNDVNGRIAEIDKIAESIVALINDSQEYNKIRSNIIEFKYNNALSLHSLYQILDN